MARTSTDLHRRAVLGGLVATALLSVAGGAAGAAPVALEIWRFPA